MMSYYCANCHESGNNVTSGDCESEDLSGEVELGSYYCVKENYSDVMEYTFDAMTMPPGGARRLNQREKAIFETWAAQGYAN
jgi:hypothetical protein